jgi:hypothetical protein
MSSCTRRRQSHPCEQDEFRLIVELHAGMPTRGCVPAGGLRLASTMGFYCDERSGGWQAKACSRRLAQRLVMTVGATARRKRLCMLYRVVSKPRKPAFGTGVPPSLANSRGVCGAAGTTALTGTTASFLADFALAALVGLAGVAA